MAKKAVRITLRTSKMGPRQAASAAWLPISKLKLERTWCRYTRPDQSDAEIMVTKGLPGSALANLLRQLENGDLWRVQYLSMNADYHSFTITEFTREKP